MLEAAIHEGVRKFIPLQQYSCISDRLSGQMINEGTSLVETIKTIYEFTKAEGEREVRKAVKEGWMQ